MRLLLPPSLPLSLSPSLPLSLPPPYPLPLPPQLSWAESLCVAIYASVAL